MTVRHSKVSHAVKWLSIATGSIILLCAIAGTGIAAVAEGDFQTVPDTAALQANTVDVQDWYESSGDTTGILTLDQTNPDNKKAVLTGSQEDSAYLTQDLVPAESGLFALEWDIYVDAIADNDPNPDRGAWMLIGDDSSGSANSADGDRFVYMFFEDNGDETMSLYAREPDADTELETGLSFDDWYTVRVELDLDTDTYDVFVDNTLVAANVAAFTQKASLTHISFATLDIGAATFHVDNVRKGPLEFVSFSPDTGYSEVDTPVDYTLTLRHENGYENIRLVRVVIKEGINDPQNEEGSIAVQIWPGAETIIGLWDTDVGDNGAWVRVEDLDSSTISLETTYGILDLSETTVTGDGNDLTLTLNITPKPAIIEGTRLADKRIWIVASDYSSYQVANLEVGNCTYGPQTTVPILIDLTETEAEAAISAATLTAGTVTEGCSDTITTVGDVISSDPIAGYHLVEGASVDFVTSTGPCPQVEVPNLVGLAEEEATTAITDAGLASGDVTEECSDTVADGNVISSDPDAGANVASGSSVNIVVSAGPCLTVPTLVGTTQAAATTAITDAGLTLGDVTEECSDTVADGSVISSDPDAGASVASGSSVNIVVSAGPCPVAVPTLVGTNRTAATAAITDAGLALGVVTEECSDTVADDNVISSDPDAESMVAPGSSVNIVVSAGPCITVPTLVGATQAAATTAITDADLTLGTVTTECSDTVADGSVISSDPAAGASVASGSSVNIVVSAGTCPIAVPTLAGSTEAAATTAITDAGLALGDVTEECSDTVADGNVISSDPDAESMAAPGSSVNIVVSTGACVDNNNDGIPDNEQDHVITLPIENSQDYITFEFSTTVTVSGLATIDNPSTMPADVDFNYGLYRFTIDNGGASEVVTIYLPDGAAPTTYYKYGPTQIDQTDHWYEFMHDGTTGAEIDGNKITLHLVDGGRGDDDLTANGTIVDDGGPGIDTSTNTPQTPSSNDSGGGGCFVSDLSVGRGMTASNRAMLIIFTAALIGCAAIPRKNNPN